LLYTPVVCLAALFGMRRSDAIALTVFCAGLVVAAMPFEAALQASRSQPALTYSVFLFAGCFFTLIGILTPVLIAVLGLLRTEQARSRSLLLNILPESTANRLKEQPGMIADRYDSCTIVFADLVGFTAHAKGKEPEQIVGELNTVFTRFDALVARHRAEKIKTIGDGYMAACGLPDPDPDHVTNACNLALDMLDAMHGLNEELGTNFALRVGVNTGSAVAGVVGTSKFSYDVWGDTVNLASRLESNGRPGLVVTSSAIAATLHGQYDIEPLGMKDLKGQGPTKIYRLARTRGAAA
jgi:class 3 adenylate cyclase